MLFGFFFDWFLVFLVGAIWAGILTRMPDAPKSTAWWFWVVGGLYVLCWGVAATGMMQAVGSPTQAGEAPQGDALITYARLGTRAVVLGGYVWLVVLSAQTFGPPGTPPSTDNTPE